MRNKNKSKFGTFGIRFGLAALMVMIGIDILSFFEVIQLDQKPGYLQPTIYGLLTVLFIVVFYKEGKSKKYDAETGFYLKTVYKDKIKELVKKNKGNQGVLIQVRLKEVKDIDFENEEKMNTVIEDLSKVLKKQEEKDVVLARLSLSTIAIYKHNTLDAKKYTAGISKLIEEFIEKNKRKYDIQYFMGIAEYPNHTNNVDELINCATYALRKLIREKRQYHSKNYLVYNVESHKEFLDKQSLYEEVEKIIKDKRVFTVFQPIVSIETGEIYGYEALSRPISDTVTNIGMLMSLADEMNIKVDLEKTFLNAISKTAFKNKDKLKGKQLFVNTSVSVNYTDKEIEKINFISNKVTNVVVEITEYEEIDFKTIGEKIDKVKTLGAQIAIDDFGSGYSNELALISLRPDILKIDLGLIRDIDTDERKFQIVENVIKYTNTNNIMTLAEGVETPGELKAVLDLGVDFIQGFIFAKPEKEVLEKKFNIEEYLEKA